MMCLIDGSRFYCSASTVMAPELRQKPVLVASGIDGISIAASRACSDAGIPKFSPIFQVKDKLALHGGVVYRANFNMLGHLSSRMMSSIINAAGSDLPHYQYSVDEMFLDLTKLHTMGIDLNEHLSHIRKRVYQETRIGTGASAGRTLTLAKVASYASKKLDGYNGQCFLDTVKHEDEVLKSMPVGEVWNVGRRLNEHFKFKGIVTAFDLKKADPKAMKKEFSVNVSNTIYELNGVPVLNFTDNRPAKQQIFSTGSHRDRLKSPEAIQTKLSDYAAEVCKKVRTQDSEIEVLTFFAHTSPYEKCPRFSQAVEVVFNPPTADTSIVMKAIRERVKRVIPENPLHQPIYKVGVGAVKLSNSEMRQYDMFNVSQDNRPLMDTLDSLNIRFGRGALSFGSQSHSKVRWSDSVEIRELPNYLTDINQLIEIKCE